MRKLNSCIPSDYSAPEKCAAYGEWLTCDFAGKLSATMRSKKKLFFEYNAIIQIGMIQCGAKVKIL